MVTFQIAPKHLQSETLVLRIKSDPACLSFPPAPGYLLTHFTLISGCHSLFAHPLGGCLNVMKAG